jgi:hypothetical protein
MRGRGAAAADSPPLWRNLRPAILAWGGNPAPVASRPAQVQVGHLGHHTRDRRPGGTNANAAPCRGFSGRNSPLLCRAR